MNLAATIALRAGGPGSGPHTGMTRHDAIRKATKIGFKSGAAVRFGHDGSVYAVLGKQIHYHASPAEQGYQEHPESKGQQLDKPVRAIPSPEPENQEGLA
jgi:hypothetical protein